MARLDSFEKRPSGMDAYLSAYGWHFSKAMCNWAVSQMRDNNGAEIKPQDKATLVEALHNAKIKVDDKGYDMVYVYAMAKADFAGSSLLTEQQVLKFVGDYLNDPDGYDEVAFTRFYADCLAKGIPIIWEDMM